jgi:hypothetical protein
MNVSGQSNGATPTSSTPGGSSFGATLLHVAWLAILLGVAMEALLLLLAGGFGILPGFESTVADLVGKVSWSTIVCAGLALGPAASKVREPVMGLLGLLAAPLAFNVSRFLQQGAVQILAVGGIAGSSTPVYLLALIKGVEYGCLGAALGWIAQRPWGGAVAHAAVGLMAGILFGSVVMAFTYWASPEPPATPDLISQGLNEIFFPVGCSLVLFSAETLGKRAAAQ